MKMDDVRKFAINLILAVLGFLSPINDFLFAVALLFGVNFICGLLADIIEGGEWKWNKAFTFVVHCFIFFGLAAFVFVCGHFMHNENGATQCVSYICYAAFYIYSVNILRNLRMLVKENTPLRKLLDFIYYVLTLKICQRIPYWSEFNSNNSNNQDNGKD